MKKILAVLLSVLMLATTGSFGLIIASALDPSGSGAVTIDGKFDEPAWVADGWVHVNNSNAKIQTELKEGEVRKENYDFQLRADDANLYVAVKFNAPPVATDTKFGNGNGTTFRLWSYTDGYKENGVEYITYNYIFESAYKPSGDVFVVRKNTNPLGNSSTDVTAASGASAKTTSGADYWYVEMQIPFALLGSTVGSHFYLTVSSPVSINGTTVVGNNAWVYPYYGDGMESNGNADAMYVEWNKDNDLDVLFEDIRIGKLPATAQKIDNFADYVSSTSTVITRVEDKTTLGDISLLTTGTRKDYNYFYLVAVDSNNRVTEINQKLGRKAEGETEIKGEKDAFVVPEGGYVLLCNATPAGEHTQAVIDAFKAIKVGDFIALYNVDLAALAAGKTKANLTNAGFTVSEKVEYAEGVTMKADPAEVSASKALDVLSDGKTELVDPSKNFNDEQVVLFKNIVCTEAGRYPVVELILNIGTPVKFDTVNLSFYHQYGVMIGLPKDNKITVSYANDPANFTTLGDYTFEGAAASGTSGVITASLALGKTIRAQYVKVSFAFGKAPWETDGKTNWEFIGMTEFSFASTTPAAGYTNLSNADQVEANKDLTVLGNGKTALDDPANKFGDAQVLLFKNKVCTTPDLFPKVEIVLAYATPKTIDTIVLGFYHEYNSMIGLPKDNKVSVSYSNDHAAGYTALGDIILEGAAEKDKDGVITYNYKLENAIKARFIKISFEFGKAPWETDGKTNWEFIGMTEFNAYGYAEGVVNASVSTDVAVLNGRSLRALIDGKVAPSLQTFSNGAAVLFQNKKTATAGTYPTVDLIFSFNQAKAIDTVKLSFYHEYISMIGLPKDNKVTISCANNYNSFTKIGDYTFEGAAESGKKGVLEAIIPLGQSVTSKYVRVSFQYGDSPFAAQSKPVWEFIALTEVSFDALEASEIDPEVPDAVVSEGKTYSGTIAARSGWADTDPATKLTDGDVGTLDKLGGSGPFVGFQIVKNVPYTYTSGAWVAGNITYTPDERDENGNFYTIIDLGEKVNSIYKYTAKFGQITAFNILFPTKVEFYASVDGISYYRMGEGVQGTVENNGAATLKEWADYTYASNTGISARYIKVVVTSAAFTDEMTPAPANPGNEGDATTVSKPIVTAVSELSVIAKSSGVLPIYSDIPVKTNGYAIDYVTASNTTYPTGFGNYTADLTDNAAHNAGSYDNKWFGFYYGTAAGVNTVNGIGTINVDLGGNKNIGGFRAHIWQPVSSGIGTPEITVFGSVNNYDWLEIGKLANPTEQLGWANLTLDYELPVRYIRFEVKQIAPNQVFVFLNEIEVLSYLYEETFSADFANQYTVGYQGPGWVYNGGGSLANVGDAVYLYTPNKGATLGEAASPNIAWWDVWVVDYDTTNARYYIKEFHASSGDSKANIAIPQNGFIIAANGHGRLSIDDSVRAGYAVGAPVYVYDINVQTLGVEDTMDFVNENTISVFAPIDGKTPFVPDLTPPKSTVTIVSDPNKVVPNKTDLSVLTDGKKALTDPTKGFNDEQVVLFQNKLTANAGTYPTVELVLDLGSEQSFNTIDLNFYIEYVSMIGLPKDNKISISYATDPNDFKALADYIIDAECNPGDKKVVEVKPILGTVIEARYVKIVFAYGDSPFAEQSKPVWEWIGLTEVGVSTTQIADLPANAMIIDNFAGFSASTTMLVRIGDKTTIGDVSALYHGTAVDYNYAYLVAVDKDGKVTDVNLTVGRPQGVKSSFVIPEGGYVLLCNLNTSATHTQAMIDAFKTIQAGDTLTLINVDLDVLATCQSIINLEKAGFTVTKGEEPDPFELKDPENAPVEITDGMIIGITDKMTIDEVKALFAGDVTISKLGTGQTITAGGQSIVIVILGDLDGDGLIDSTDYLIIKKAILGNYTLNAAQLKAACVSGSQEPESIDYLMIKKHILGNYNLFTKEVQ